MSKFLNYDEGGLTYQDLNNGSLPIYVNKIRVTNILPNLPVKTDESKNLYATKIDVTDINGDTVQNPYNGTLEVKDLETSTYFSINDELDKITNFEASSENNTNVTGNLNLTGEVSTTQVTDTTKLTRIELDDTDINIISQNLTFNGNDIVTSPDLEELETKTFYIDGTLHLDGTVFSNNIYADGFKINNDTAPPKKLYSDGSLTTRGDLIYLDNEPVNEDVNRTYFDKSLNYYAASDANFPVQPALPSYYLSTINISNEADLVNFCSSFSDRVDVCITQSFTISSQILINSLVNKCKIRGLTQNITLSCNLSTSMFSIYAEEITFENITLLNSNIGSNATIITFPYVAATGYITNCIFRTNEYAISSVAWNLIITNNAFTFYGTADTHRYIILSGLKNVYINNNIFEGNATSSSTQCVNINNGLASAFLNGNLIMKNNVSQNLPVQRLLMVDIALTGSNFSIYASNNTMTTTSGFMLFYVLPLDGVKQIYVVNNTETLGPSITGSKGLIGLDSAASSVISFNTKIYSANNTVPLLRADYTNLVNEDAIQQQRVIAYATARFTTINKYDVVVPFVGNTNAGGGSSSTDIIALQTKTQNLQGTSSLNTLSKSTLFNLSGSENVTIAADGFNKVVVNGTSTTVSGNLNADAFVKTGGTCQQYLMANGSVLQYSANSGNSNFYLYNSSSTVTASPSSGQVTYDDAVQNNATMIYISHLTTDNIDIEFFYSQIGTLNDVYIQDKNDSENNIQYNITGAPTITLGNKIAIPVFFSSASGTGATSFGNNHPVLISFLTNSIETDTRLTSLETSRLNKNGSIVMTGNLNMGLNKIVSMIDPSDAKDACNKGYTDTQDLLKLNLTGGTMSGILNMGSNKIINLATPTIGTDGANRAFVETQTNLKLNISGGTMTGAIAMGGNNISGVGTMSGSSISLSSGTASQFLMGNGSLLSSTLYPTITSISGNATYNGVNIPYIARRVGIAGEGIVTLFINNFTVVPATTTATLISSSFLPAGYRPTSNAVWVPCRIRKNNIIQMGTMIFYLSGELGITDITNTTNFWTTTDTNCGIANNFSASFPTV